MPRRWSSRGCGGSGTSMRASWRSCRSWTSWSGSRPCRRLRRQARSGRGGRPARHGARAADHGGARAGTLLGARAREDLRQERPTSCAAGRTRDARPSAPSSPWSGTGTSPASPATTCSTSASTGSTGSRRVKGTANSANKDLIHLGDVLKTVNTMKRLGLALPLGRAVVPRGRGADPAAVQRGLDHGAAACPRGARRPERSGAGTAAGHGQHRLPAVRGGGADRGHDPAGLRRAAHRDRARWPAAEVPLLPARDPAGRRLAWRPSRPSPRASRATATARP
jgi:hypothetical protein